MDTNKYVIFLSVLKNRSFSGAAEELGYTQSAISHSISSLEEEFGIRLFNRDKGNLSLTRSGIDILPFIRGVVDQQKLLEENISAYRAVEAGTLYFASVESIAIQHFPKLLRMYHERYPKIRITILDGNYEEVEEMLSAGRVEFGISSVSDRTPYERISLVQEQIEAVLPCNHPLCSKDQLSLHDLENEPFILPGEGLHHQIGQLMQKYNLNFDTIYSVTDDNLTVALVSSGIGVSLLPQMSFENYLNFPFCAKPLIESPTREVAIIYKNYREISAIGKSFIAFAQNFFSSSDQQ